MFLYLVRNYPVVFRANLCRLRHWGHFTMKAMCLDRVIKLKDLWLPFSHFLNISPWPPHVMDRQHKGKVTKKNGVRWWVLFK